MNHAVETSHSNDRDLLDARHTDSKSDTAELISFAIGDDHYGVDIMAVREIKNWSGVSALTGQPDYVRGVLNLRGVVVPIIDLRCRFGQGLTDATPTHIVIIVSIRDQLVGLLADRVLDIVPFETARIQPVPHVSSGSSIGLLSGLLPADSGMIALIDLLHLLELPVSSSIASQNV